MDPQLDPTRSSGYTSASQIARRLTEPWAEQHLYCVACPSAHIIPTKTNTAVIDFQCPRCDATYQLKSQAGPFRKKVQNSAYGVKMRAIEEGRMPNYAFLQYSRNDWLVRELFVIPGHFFTPAVVEARKPLSPQARRAGWIGSNILLHALPPDARVTVLSAGQALDPVVVRQNWRRFAFLKDDVRARGGWGADVLDGVRQLQRETGVSEFTLQSYYD